jgi:hypothetical protein
MEHAWADPAWQGGVPVKKGSSMATGIFLIQESGELNELSEQQYEAENVLQQLLANHPNLLAGDQINPTAPRRWLLISREQAVPDEEGGSGRWALDHLFLDQDPIPTLVEIKRSTDTRVRREVVGQMLDYAANAVVYWSAEEIRSRFEARCEAAGEDAAQVVADFLEGGDPEAFWQDTKRNLQAGKVRMVFVADAIPTELQRIVEFLNGQMDPAEVLAVEVRQFVGQGVKALVPKVVGQTAAALQAKSATPAAGKRQWDEASFFADLKARKGPEQTKVARAIYEWAEQRGLRIWFGQGKQDGSFFPMVDHATGSDWTIGVWTYGRVEVQFQHLAREHAFGSAPPITNEAKRRELLERLNAVPGVSLPEDAIGRRPGIPLAVFVVPGALDQFLKVLDWLVDQLRGEGEPAPPSGDTIGTLVEA